MPIAARTGTDGATQRLALTILFSAGLFFHVVGEGVVNLARKAENVTDKENYIDFRLRLLGEPGKLAGSRHVRAKILTIRNNTKTQDEYRYRRDFNFTLAVGHSYATHATRFHRHVGRSQLPRQLHKSTKTGT